VPGRLVIFPPLWIFPHAGLPPRDRPKYIVHRYLWYPPASEKHAQ
jgi:prolyl 4-hydroxylase